MSYEDYETHMGDWLHRLRTGDNYLSSPLRSYGSAAGAATEVGFLIALPWPVPRPFTADRIAVHVETAGLAGAAIRLGIYEDDGNCYPGALLLDAGAVDCTTTGLKTITIDQSLKRGLYWLAFVGNDATIKIYKTNYYNSIIGYINSLRYTAAAWRKAQAYGALPNPYPAGAGGLLAGFILGLRIASMD